MSFTIREPSQSGLDLLFQSLGGGLGQGLGKSIEQFYQNKSQEEQQRKLLNQGFSPLAAQMFSTATEGGKTEITKQFLEELGRGGEGPLTEFFSKRTPSGEIVGEVEIPSEKLTPKEQIKREEGRFSKQADKYEQLENKSAGFQQEKIRINRLQELNASGKLPSNLGRLNVNPKSGNLILPFASSPETQEFTKIVNDFLTNAKDTFGARVTNFEINAFLKRLPSLLNSEQGRSRVLRQMEIINEINNLHSQSIIDEIEKAGGIRKIDIDRARAQAKKGIKNQEEDLKKEYVDGEKFLNELKKEKFLDTNTAADILREAKGDVELARKIAKKKGYQF